MEYDTTSLKGMQTNDFDWYLNAKHDKMKVGIKINGNAFERNVYRTNELYFWSAHAQIGGTNNSQMVPGILGAFCTTKTAKIFLLFGIPFWYSSDASNKWETPMSWIHRTMRMGAARGGDNCGDCGDDGTRYSGPFVGMGGRTNGRRTGTLERIHGRRLGCNVWRTTYTNSTQIYIRK